MITRIDHPALTVSDLKASVAFYTELLGFRPHQTIEVPGMHIEYLKLGDTLLELFQAKDTSLPVHSKAGAVGYRHLCLYSDDVDADAAMLKEKDVEFTMEPRDATGVRRIAFFKDPDGFLIELVQR